MRASSFGSCVRALVAEELGYVQLDPPDKIREVFNAGNEAEVVVLERLKAHGWLVVDQQMEVEFMGVTGHIDGRSMKYGTIEIKSMNDETYKKWVADGWNMGGLMEKYKWQMSVYMCALEPNPLTMIAYNRETGSMYQRTVHQPFYKPREVMDRIAEVMRWADMGELPPCDQTADNYACPYRNLHLPTEFDRDELVESLGVTYRELLDEKALVEKKIASVRVKLEESLDAMGKTSLDCPRVKVTVYTQQNPAQVNRDQMKADGIWEKYMIPGQMSKRLRVTLRGVTDEQATEQPD